MTLQEAISKALEEMTPAPQGEYEIPYLVWREHTGGGEWTSHHIEGDEFTAALARKITEAMFPDGANITIAEAIKRAVEEAQNAAPCGGDLYFYAYDWRDHSHDADEVDLQALIQRTLDLLAARPAEGETIITDKDGKRFKVTVEAL